MEYNIDFLSEPNTYFKPIIAFVNQIKNQKFIQDLNDSRIQYKYIAVDLKALAENQTRIKSKNRGIDSKFDYDSTYHTLDAITNQLESIKDNYKTKVKVISIGNSYENRDIKGVLISTNEDNPRIVVFECGIHSREWISVSFCLWSINRLLNDNKLLKNYQFLIVPVLNVDGYVYTWTTDRLWRKTRQQNDETDENSCFGIDLNRNWKTREFCKHSATYDECGITYCGKHAFSAPETQTFSKYLLDIRHKIFAYFAIHSYSQYWIYPYGYTSQSVPNSQYLYNLSQIGVNALTKLYGTQYKLGQIKDILYQCSGTSSDWVYDTLGVELVFMLELRSDENSIDEFELPNNQIKPTCEETWAGIEAMLEYVSLEKRFNTQTNTVSTFCDKSKEFWFKLLLTVVLLRFFI